MRIWYRHREDRLESRVEEAESGRVHEKVWSREREKFAEPLVLCCSQSLKSNDLLPQVRRGLI